MTRVGTRIVGRTARTSMSVISGNIISTIAGLAAMRSYRAQVARISSFHGMSGFNKCAGSPVPQRGAISALVSRARSTVVGIRVALDRNQCGRAGWMCCREQRTGRKRVEQAAQDDRLTASEIVQHRCDAVGPLLHTWAKRPV